MLFTIRRNFFRHQLLKYDKKKNCKSVFFFKRKVCNGINISTSFIVNCVKEAYKSKNFSKIKWNCLSNDILKNKDRFNLKELLDIINILSRLHFGRNILIQFIPLLVSKLSDLESNSIAKILTSYAKANILDDQFYNQLCLKLQNNLNNVSHSSLINLLYNINFHIHIKNGYLLDIERKALVYIASKFEIETCNDADQSTKTASYKNEKIESDQSKDIIVKKNLKNDKYVNKKAILDSNNSKLLRKSSNLEKISQINSINWKVPNLGNYNFILLFYSLSNYLFNLYLKNENMSIDIRFLNQLCKCHDAMYNMIINKNLLNMLKEINIFHIFLLYKASLNTIYTFGGNPINNFLFDSIKEQISNFILLLKNDDKPIKGQTNELIRYIDILKHNLVHYKENKKKNFEHYYDDNVMLIKTILSILQAKNKSDIKK